MVEIEKILDELIETISPRFASLFNEILPIYQKVTMLDNETAEFNPDDHSIDEEIFELLNDIVDTVDQRLKNAVVLHITGKYMTHYDWDDFEFKPHIDLEDPTTRIGFLFFLDFLCLAISHSILQENEKEKNQSICFQLFNAHRYFNHLVFQEAADREDRIQPKLKWPVLLYNLFDSYIPPVYGVNQTWKQIESHSKKK